MTRALAATDFLERFEYENTSGGGGARGANSGKTVRPAKKQQHDAEAVPKPAIANARGGDHPVANPARRLPAVDAPHDPVVAVLDVSPDGFRQCHDYTSARPVGLEPRIDVPEHARSLLRALQLGSPPLAEANFVDPVKASDRRDERRQRQERRGDRGFFIQQAAGKPENVACDFQKAAILAMDNPAAGAQSGEEFLDGARTGNFGERLRHACECVRIAAGYTGLAEFDGHLIGLPVGFPPHLAVAHFEGWQIGSEPVEVFQVAASREAGEHVISGEEQLTLGEIHQKRNKIIPTALNFRMILFGDAV